MAGSFRFTLYRGDGLSFGRSNDRQDLENLAMHEVTVVRAGEPFPIYYVNANPPNIIVSVVTNDANGPKIHRLDGWEPPKVCEHQINPDSLRLKYTPIAGVAFFCMKCGRTGEFEFDQNIRWENNGK